MFSPHPHQQFKSKMLNWLDQYYVLLIYISTIANRVVEKLPISAADDSITERGTRALKMMKKKVFFNNERDSLCASSQVHYMNAEEMETRENIMNCKFFFHNCREWEVFLHEVLSLC
jgi:hypothetical protein